MMGAGEDAQRPWVSSLFLAQSTFHVLFRNGYEVGIVGARERNEVKTVGVKEGMTSSPKVMRKVRSRGEGQSLRGSESRNLLRPALEAAVVARGACIIAFILL